MRITTNLNKKELDYLDMLIFEDAVATDLGNGNRSAAIKYCINMCRHLESIHGKDHFIEPCELIYKENNPTQP